MSRFIYSKLFLVIVLVTQMVHGAIVKEITDDITTTQKPQNENDTNVDLIEEARKQKEQGMMNRILPLMIIPFMVSTMMIPMMLISLKMMLLKSALTGKLAVIMLILNLFRRRSSGQGGVFNHNVMSEKDMSMSMAHYGYSGNEEYGAYVNRRKRKNVR